jgi:hypothetical protein
MRAVCSAARRAVVGVILLQVWVLAACADGGDDDGEGERQGGVAGSAATAAGAGGSGGAAGSTQAGAAGMSGGGGNGSAGVAGTRAQGDGGVDDAGGPVDAGDDEDDEDSTTDEDEPDEPVDAGTPNVDDPDGDGDPTWPPPPASDELEDLPEELASGICAALDGCLGDTLLEVALDGSDCEARTESELRDGDFVFVQASIDAGRLSFDADGVAACVADYAALGCEVVTSRAPASCKSMLEGQVELDEACVLDDDCAAGAFCNREDACPGLCAELLSEGDDCDRNDQCESGLICLGGECADDAGEGDDCDGGVAPPCHLGTVCIGDVAEEEQAGTCRAEDDLLVVEEGDECDIVAGEWCEDGLACVVDVVGSGAGASVVTVCMERVGSGDDCHTALLPQQCPTGEYCPADLNPDYLAECVARPDEGHACGAFGICAPDHYCDGDHCKPFRLPQGMPCTLDGECLSQRCEDDEDDEGSHCVALDRCRLDGPTECGDESCSGDETCESCEEDCGECPPDPECGDESCNGDETCESCEEDCGECPPEPECGDDDCNGDEDCESCEEDCGACGPTCGDETCEAGETCASCDDDCGVCPAPYSGPCDADADCAPDQTCVEHTVPGLLGLTPDIHYGYCAETCEVVAECAASPKQRTCTSAGSCALSCDVFACLLDISWCCPVGDECIQGVCTHRR